MDEGDFVEAGQVLARMDTRVLEAQRREAEAQPARAEIAVDTARSLVTQRDAERAAAQAVVAWREAEAEAAQKRLARTEDLAERGTAPIQPLDADRAQAEAAQAACRLAGTDSQDPMDRSIGSAYRRMVTEKLTGRPGSAPA